MSPIHRIRLTLAGIAIAVAGIITACSNHYDNNGYDNCPDWQCGPGLFYAPMIIPAYGIYGQPGYHAPVTIQPNQPGYKPTYVGKPPNFTPPSGAKVAPKGQQPPKDYKAPSGSTLTVQKAPQKSGNSTGGGSSSGGSSGGSKQTVQKAPSGSGSSSGGSKSSGGSSSGGSKSGGSSSSGGSKK